MIEIKHVDKVYLNGFKALSDVNLTIQDGEFVSIIGLSGAGKSTLIRCINRMHDISGGEILIDGVDISSLKGKKLRSARKDIGMIFQSFNLVKRSTVFKNVLAGRVGYHNTFETLFNIYSKDEKMLALRSLDKLGILDKAYVRADQLSGGQQQRVALARALTQDPKLILADEPVASLDPVTTISVMDDFTRINKLGITIIANMHHVDLAKRYSTRIIGVKAGQVVFDGKPEEVTDEVTMKIYGRALNKNENLGLDSSEEK
ncbi:MAG: phosphonate ABC transporter ATP-binding protein [Mollicutes bacterium]|nr:phosphonate ABC transporter ATP-binding protein [Mollicutes bacterium]MDY6069944.1 phosphonate ABC transporter ATP-binding protein [Bacilli bacterium]